MRGKISFFRIPQVLLGPCSLNEYVLIPQKWKYQVWREMSQKVGGEAFLLEGPELLGGTDIYYRSSCLIKSKRNKQMCIHRKIFLLLMQQGFVRTIQYSFFKELSGWLFWLRLLFSSNWNFSGFNLQSWFFLRCFSHQDKGTIYSFYFLSAKVLTCIKQSTLSAPSPPFFFNGRLSYLSMHLCNTEQHCVKVQPLVSGAMQQQQPALGGTTWMSSSLSWRRLSWNEQWLGCVCPVVLHNLDMPRFLHSTSFSPAFESLHWKSSAIFPAV